MYPVHVWIIRNSSKRYPKKKQYVGTFIVLELPFPGGRKRSICLPSGKRLHDYGKSPCYQWVNPRFLWSFSSSQTVSHYQRLANLAGCPLRIHVALLICTGCSMGQNLTTTTGRIHRWFHCEVVAWWCLCNMLRDVQDKGTMDDALWVFCIWLWLTVCHGKSHFFIGKPSIDVLFAPIQHMMKHHQVRAVNFDPYQDRFGFGHP